MPPPAITAATLPAGAESEPLPHSEEGSARARQGGSPCGKKRACQEPGSCPYRRNSLHPGPCQAIASPRKSWTLGLAVALSAQVGRRGHHTGPTLALLLGRLVVDAHANRWQAGGCMAPAISDHRATTDVRTPAAIAAALTPFNFLARALPYCLCARAMTLGRWPKGPRECPIGNLRRFVHPSSIKMTR